MTEAIFGLVGVIVGGLLNGGVTWLTNRQESKGRVKVAARLVLSELEMVEVSATSALKLENYGQLTFGDSSAWLEKRGTLAAALSDKDWSRLDNCYMFFIHLKNQAESGLEWDDHGKESLDSMILKAKSSLEALRKHAGADVKIMAGLYRDGDK